MLTESNAFFNSVKTPIVILFLSKASNILFVSSRMAIRVECLLLKPYWRFFRMSDLIRGCSKDDDT